jgi:hypothetical protein
MPRGAARYGDRVALVFRGEEFTYNRLDELTARLANGLKELGISQGDRVTLNFNEAVATPASADAHQLVELPVSGDSLGVGATAATSGSSLLVTLGADPVLRISGAYDSLQTTAGNSSGLGATASLASTAGVSASATVQDLIAPALVVGFQSTASLITGRGDHTATLLDDGRVLVIGGGSFTTDGFETFKRAEIWNPAMGTFRPAGRLARPRLCHSSTRLPDGRVLVIGGLMNRAKSEATRSKAHRSAEVRDPFDHSFDPVGSLTVISGCNTAGLLPEGRVLVVGSGDTDPEASETAEVAETWDPTTGSFSPAGSLIGARSGHTVTILPDSRALVIGGVDESGDYLVTAEIYDPS